jgi:hypothetical protein
MSSSDVRTPRPPLCVLQDFVHARTRWYTVALSYAWKLSVLYSACERTEGPLQLAADEGSHDASTSAEESTR